MNDVKPSESSADFVAAFAELARRLAEIEVIVSDLRLYFGGFRSWELVAVKSEVAARIFFDGRDRFVTAEVSPVRRHSAPNQWKRVDAKGISNGYEESIAFAEEFLRKRFEKEEDGNEEKKGNQPSL
jgi:hypothetical protein